MNHSLSNLIEWYCAQCDGLWEHSYGISITTIDNPGFRVAIDLRGTKLEDASYQSVSWESGADGDGEWYECFMGDEKKWNGACSPKMLERVLELFIEWSKSHG